MTGISVNRTLGSDYYKYPVSLLDLQPYIKRPCTFTPSTGSSVTCYLKKGRIYALNIKESIAM